ncbi:MAG: phenylalanine--tRNA ligase subunit alpha [Acidobacteriota bacterium]|jgi:phenylalanyl-tRNA synthetase alpha chain|nr:phenylalanine--tRNA ligase subunit alpha [Acidobacteriota bacterium]
MKEFAARLKEVRRLFDQALDQAQDARSLEGLRNRFLSRKKGLLAGLFEDMKSLPNADKPEAGRLLNEFKAAVQEGLTALESRPAEKDSPGEGFDPTLPGRVRYRGAPHPIHIFQQEIESIFLGMGFSIEDGPEIETDFYNFEALNFPPHHPARDSWDTFYVTDDLLLRTHTSPVQVRVMEKRKPPIRIIIPGKVYRRETPDPTHLPMFHQVEGLVVDEGITFAHLKGTLESFLRALFGDNTKIRFRPSFFPFTEPSAEVDVECLACSSRDPGCRICGGTGWKEILGAGMVDPQVFKNVNIDPEKYTGWAFGMGIDRMAMFAYQIPELRLFYENDLRFLRQFHLK